MNIAFNRDIIQTLTSKKVRTCVGFLFFILTLIYLLEASPPTLTEENLRLPVLVEKAPEPPEENLIPWQEVTTRPGDSLAIVFKRMGLSPQTLHALMDQNPHAKKLSNLKPNQTLKFLIHETELEQLILPLSQTESLAIKYEDGRYHTHIHQHETEVQPQTKSATVHHSLYVTAKQAGISYALIRQMTEILGWEINFARDVREGDQFTLHYEAHYIENQLIHTGNILAVSYTTRGKTFEAIRHKTNHGETDYFTPEGQSLRKAFTRYPVQFSHISSSFSLSRMHPVLQKKRPHRGVDLAAPIGTPIYATSDGRITSIGYENGFGNKIKIKHAGPYASVYAHMLKFKKGLSRGSEVKRGEIIGYVGQTGLATGPHCHYEFHVNNQPHNPSTVKLPQALPVQAHELASFKTHAATTLAELQRYKTINVVTEDATRKENPEHIT